MNILQLTWSRMRAYGGIQSTLRGLVAEAKRRGCHSHLCALPSRFPQHQPKPDDQHVLSEGNFETELDDLVDGLKIEVLHAHNLHIGYTPAVQAKVANVARRHAIPLLITVHDLRGAKFDPSTAGQVVADMPDATYVVTSRYNDAIFKEDFGFCPAAVIPPGTDFSRFANTKEPAIDTICFPARLDRRKGVLRAIEVSGVASGQLGSLHLLLSDPNCSCVGEDPFLQGDIERLMNTYPALSHRFLGGDSVIPDIYVSSAVTLALPHSIEGFGLVPLESLAAARPVIAAPTGGMWWLENVEGTSVFADYNGVRIAKTLVNVIREWPLWHEAALRARCRLAEEHDVRRVCGAYLELYERLLANLRVRPAATYDMPMRTQSTAV